MAARSLSTPLIIERSWLEAPRICASPVSEDGSLFSMSYLVASLIADSAPL
ncbi:hypothetical protein D3C71_1305620 [compost metagenome]